ncbi:MAG: c-type cytochrome [Leptolyngbya sp. RL_3_1]|nr:c-type cytochrome [Leptolyngbya sp. RL_3_1]
MKRIWAIATGIVLALMVFVPSAWAGDVDGAQIFTNNCAACHLGGGNVINGAKTLKMADLTANGKDTVEAIQTQVTNGNGAMPAFGGRLTESEIEAVANYVLAQADSGW